jgi:hypothetical protein
LRGCPCDLGASARWGAMIYIRDVVAALLLCVGIAGSVVAGPLEDGAAALERGDYATAMQLWRPLAEQGDTVVQALLWLMYANDAGVPETMQWRHESKS